MAPSATSLSPVCPCLSPHPPPHTHINTQTLREEDESHRQDPGAARPGDQVATRWGPCPSFGVCQLDRWGL